MKQFERAMRYLQDYDKKIQDYIHTGCPISKVPLCFCSFLGFWSTYRGTSDLYSTALEICYIIATRILKIDSEIAEIIDVKDGTCDTKIISFTLCNSKMSISK